MWTDPPAAADAVVRETHVAAPRSAPLWIGGMARALSDPAAERAVSVSELARSLGRTPAHASRAFKTHFGLGPAAFRREHRIRLALLLIRGGVPLADSALLAGFSDQSHLGRELRRATGRTPREWRSAVGSGPRPISRSEVNSVLERFGL
jgi:AraC-like DNA-binding protein